MSCFRSYVASSRGGECDCASGNFPCKYKRLDNKLYKPESHISVYLYLCISVSLCLYLHVIGVKTCRESALPRLPPAACIMNHFIIIIITISSAIASRRHGHCQNFQTVQTFEKLNIVFTSRSANNKLTSLSEQNIAHVPSTGSQRTARDERFASECRNKETKKRFCGIKRATGCVPRFASRCSA